MEWFWEIKAKTGGPNYFLQLDFERSISSQQTLIESFLTDYRKANGEWRHHNSGDHSYTGISIAPTTIFITKGWGNSSASDDSFLLDLLQALAIPFKWTIFSGGEGYANVIYTAGQNLEALVAYVRLGSMGNNQENL